MVEAILERQKKISSLRPLSRRGIRIKGLSRVPVKLGQKGVEEIIQIKAQPLKKRQPCKNHSP